MRKCERSINASLRNIAVNFQKTLIQIQNEIRKMKIALSPLWMEVKKRRDCFDTIMRLLKIDIFNQNKYNPEDHPPNHLFHLNSLDLIIYKIRYILDLFDKFHDVFMLPNNHEMNKDIDSFITYYKITDSDTITNLKRFVSNIYILHIGFINYSIDSRQNIAECVNGFSSLRVEMLFYNSELLDTSDSDSDMDDDYD
jgi:hypothetical protein